MRDTSPPRLQIHLLGQFLVRVSGQALAEAAIKGRKARSLLKLIALQRHFQLVRDQAMEALWPELDATSAAAQLYKALHRIRKAFALQEEEATDWIEITDDLIRLVPPGRVVTDVQHFEQAARAGLRDGEIADLETAVSTYAGDLLPMDLYTDWALLPREHYRQLYLDVLLALAAAYEQRGELPEAAEMLRLALEKEPVLEQAHRGLMRIFAHQGQASRAFRQYDLCRKVLRRELAMGPSFETRETLAAVRQQHSSKRAAPNTLRVTTPAPMPPLIGRVAECNRIDAALHRLPGGSGGALIICGGVGLGKTRLIQELAMRARRRGCRVLSGGAREGEGATAYGPFVDLFEAVLRQQPELQEHLPVELGRLMPSFTGREALIPHADRLAAQGYLFAQVRRFFARLAGKGAVVVTLEDLHAADEGSRALFAYLVRHSEALPVLFAATVRDETAGSASKIVEALEERSATVMTLAPLTLEEESSLLQQHAATPVSPEAAERIFRLSEGNPLFALELLRYQERDGAGSASDEEVSDGLGRPASPTGQIPPSLRHTVERQLEGLSPAAHHLLYIAAVIGRSIPFDLLSSVWSGAEHFDEARLFESLEELERAQLLDRRGLDYSFRHALVREAVYASISEARLRALHARVAGQLVSCSTGMDDAPVEQIAYHFVRAGEVRQGVHYLVRAGERAEAAYAHDDALGRFREALALLETAEDTRARRIRRDVLERIGDVQRACGRLERSYEAYEEAVALAEKVPMSEPDLVELHRKIALVAIFRTEMDRCNQHLARAFELAGEEKRARARLFVIEALRLWHVNRLEEACEVAREALALAESVEAPEEASQACEILALACLPLGRWEEGLHYEMQRHVHGWSPEIVVATDAHLCLWEYHVAGHQPFQQARSFIRRVAEQASQLGDLRCVAVCHYALGTMHLWRGEDRQAVRELQASLELHRRVGSPAGMAYTQARKGVLHTLRGATELGWESVQKGLVNAEQAAVRDHCLQRLYGVGLWNRLEAGDHGRARSVVEKSRALLEETGACAACALELYPWLAYFYLQTGEIDHTRECAAAVSELAATTGNPIGEAVAAMIDSSLLVVDEAEQQALRRRRQAFELAQRVATEVTHAPVVHYLDRMTDQQKELRRALA